MFTRFKTEVEASIAVDKIASRNIIDRLFDRINYERQTLVSSAEFKLNNMLHLLEELGDPHLACPVIHVAGTKGKGSVCAMIGAILDAAGYRTGIYNSPHLERINQRIIVDGQEITDADLADVLSKLEPVVTTLDARARQKQTKKLTFFEVVTSAAFQYYCDQQLDAVVVEVGMGGRLDSTNVCQPEICVVTNISLDHTRQLGSTVDKIAGEKAGIIKPGVPVVSGVVDPMAREVIRRVAKDNGSNLIELNQDFRIEPNQNCDTFSCMDVSNIRCGMPGRHQRSNAAIAIAVCSLLRQSDWQISHDAIRKGLGQATLPGRCEVIPIVDSPSVNSGKAKGHVILDMAHNEASVAALARTLQSEIVEFANAKTKVLIFAASREKDVAAMFRPIIGLFDLILLTKYQDNPRGRSVSELNKIALDSKEKLGVDTTVLETDDPLTAWQQAVEAANREIAICVTGSAFLVAELRPHLISNGDP